MLDTEAGSMFRVIQRFQQAMDDADNTNLFAVFDGPTIERWFVKYLLGGLASGSFGAECTPGNGLRADLNRKDILDSLFRGSGESPHWTLYQSGITGRPFKKRADVESIIYYGPDGCAWGCGVAFGPAALQLAFGNPTRTVRDQELIVRPAGIITNSAIVGTETFLALSWTAMGSKLSSYTYWGNDDEENQRVSQYGHFS